MSDGISPSRPIQPLVVTSSSEPLCPPQHIHTYYEISRTARWVAEHSSGRDGWKIVALQFPDHLLGDAAQVVELLTAELQGMKLEAAPPVDAGEPERAEKVDQTATESTAAEEMEMDLDSVIRSQFVVMGDTSYGSCCVDEVTAAHAQADAIVHYGTACLSKRDHEVPVLYIFGRSIPGSDDSGACLHVRPPLRLETMAETLPAALQEHGLQTKKRLLVFYDLQSQHEEAEIRTAFQTPTSSASSCPEIIVGRVLGPDTSPESIRRAGKLLLQFCGFHFFREDEEGDEEVVDADWLGESAILYIGEELPSVTNICMNFPQCPVIRWRRTVITGQTQEEEEEEEGAVWQREDAFVNKLLHRRYFLVEKVKRAHIIGILAGTLGVENYLETIRKLQTVINAAGKRSYLIVVGKINGPKLGNFPEVDAFVLVACTLSSLLDSREFEKDVVTPFEVYTALTPGGEWTGDYTTDFNSNLLHRRQLLQTGEGGAEEEQEGETASDSSSSRTVIRRQDWEILGTEERPTAANFLLQRTFQGLDLSESPDREAGWAASRSCSRCGGVISIPETRELILSEREQGQEMKEAGQEIPPARVEPGLSGIAREYRDLTPQESCVSSACRSGGGSGGGGCACGAVRRPPQLLCERCSGDPSAGDDDDDGKEGAGAAVGSRLRRPRTPSEVAEILRHRQTETMLSDDDSESSEGGQGEGDGSGEVNFLDFL